MANVTVRRKSGRNPAKPRRKPTRTRQSAPKQSKLDKLLNQQQRILQDEETIKRREAAIEHDEQRIEKLEEREVSLEQQAIDEERKGEALQVQENQELRKLEMLEQDVKREVSPHPLTHVTVKDFIKGLVGAFVGVVVHFTFTYGVEIAEHVSMARAVILLLVTLVIGGCFLYATGFRRIKDKSLQWFLPYRLLILYATAILVTTATLSFFYPHFYDDTDLAFRRIAVVNLSAVIGACTADLIGRE